MVNSSDTVLVATDVCPLVIVVAKVVVSIASIADMVSQGTGSAGRIGCESGPMLQSKSDTT